MSRVFKASIQRPALLPAIFCCLMIVLAGCATQPGDVQQTPGKLDDLTLWRIEGKLGFRSPNKNGSAFLRWTQRDSAYELRLNGPFGAAATEIRGDDDFAVLSQSGRDDLSAQDGEALSTQLFGWPFPVGDMPFWVKGLATEGSRATSSYTEAGLLQDLQQRGWILQFSNYRAFGKWTLPTRIKGDKADYGFTLVIKQWDTDIDPTEQP